MSTLSQFLGSGGGGIAHEWPTTQSITFTAPFTAKYLVTAIGGGGSGGRGNRSGGGAGGFCQQVVSLEAGDSLVLTIGAGGLSPGAAGDGNPGGTTTVTGPGISLTANGGAGGAAAGAAGGTASGGTVNRTGGSGAAYTATATGGGAVDVYGYGTSITSSFSSGSAGGSVGGGGSASAPGGALLFGILATETVYPIPLPNRPYFLGNRTLQPAGFKVGNAPAGSHAEPGAGGTVTSLYKGGLFAGGAGNVSSAGSDGGFFGGGGGGQGSGSAAAGNGGVGGVIIEWIVS